MTARAAAVMVAAMETTTTMAAMPMPAVKATDTTLTTVVATMAAMELALAATEMMAAVMVATESKRALSARARRSFFFFSVRSSLADASGSCADNRLGKKLMGVVSVQESKNVSRKHMGKQFARDEKHAEGALCGRSGLAGCARAHVVSCRDFMCCALGVYQHLQMVAKCVAIHCGS